MARDAQLKVEMGAGAVAGIAGLSENHARHDELAFFDVGFIQVGVKGIVGAVHVLDLDIIPITYQDQSGTLRSLHPGRRRWGYPWGRQSLCRYGL